MTDTHTLKDLLQSITIGAPTRTVWTPTDFCNLGNRDAVDKCLQRLVAAGDLRRIDRGLYDRPAVNILTKKPAPPDARAIIDAIARRDQIRVLVDGLTAANDLGLTNAVPAKIVAHVDARLRPIVLGNLVITFRPTAASKLYWAGRPAMRLVQAMHWLKDVIDRDDGQILSKIDRILADKDLGPDIRDDIDRGMFTLPAWMQNVLRQKIGSISGDDGTYTNALQSA
ncbi:DUF6088 family protein [Asticcacaulis sp.]|uniref:DUF6088 family protein n=1 Tax=Asticcacaulis sp. TaxID=1872648 RepID=UPI002BC22228|nr:DUF6088 family protein [Asticcacaulis sp.]HTM82264.1 DUF6088 family protein [Asticcacaulis sp.]